MRVLIVDPSPVAQNLYRVLLHSCATELRVMTREGFSHRDTAEEFSDVDVMLIASRVLEGEQANYRALLTDIPHWAEMPKLVMVRPGANGDKAAWKNLPNALELQRPFRPEEFERAVKKVMKG